MSCTRLASVILALPVMLLLMVLLQGCAQSGDPAMKRGLALYKEDDFEGAQKEFKTAIGLELTAYTRPEALTMLGNTFEELESYDSAIYYHHQALALDSTYARAWVNIGISHRLNGKLDSAEYSYLRAAKIDPDDSDLLSSLGALYIFRDDYNRAIEYLRKSLKIDSESPGAHANLSIALAMSGDMEGALAEEERALELGYKNAAKLRARLEELEQAEE